MKELKLKELKLNKDVLERFLVLYIFIKKPILEIKRRDISKNRKLLNRYYQGFMDYNKHPYRYNLFTLQSRH